MCLVCIRAVLEFCVPLGSNMSLVWARHTNKQHKQKHAIQTNNTTFNVGHLCSKQPRWLGRPDFCFHRSVGEHSCVMAASGRFDPGDPASGYSVLGWQHRLHVDWVSNSDYILTDVLTGAKCVLDGLHEVVCLDEFCIVIHAETMEEHCPAKLLQKDVVQSLELRECFLCTVNPDDGSYLVISHFDNAMSSHEPGTAKLMLGNCNATADWNIAVMEQGRYGKSRYIGHWLLAMISSD